MKRLTLLAVLSSAAFMTGCGQRLVDFLVNPPDFAHTEDMHVDDLSMSDLTGADLASADSAGDGGTTDGGLADGGVLDQSVPDLSVLADLSKLPDMVKLPDLTEPADLSPPCEALSLNGVHAIVTAGPEPYYNPSGAFTVEGWVYQTSRTAVAAVAGHTGNPLALTASYELEIDASGHVVLEVSSTGILYDLTATTTATVPLNTWTHVAGQLSIGSSSVTAAVFINGGSSVSASTLVTSYRAASVNVPVNVGRFSSATSSSGLATDEAPFAGYMHDVRFSSVARYPIATPIDKRFVPDPNTFVLYHFDEDSGMNAADDSTNGIPGALQQGAVFATPLMCP